MTAPDPRCRTCPGCGLASRSHTAYPWPPTPNATDLPVSAPSVPRWRDWRCRFCVAAAVHTGALSERLRIQRRLIEAGAMGWPAGDAA